MEKEISYSYTVGLTRYVRYTDGSSDIAAWAMYMRTVKKMLENRNRIERDVYGNRKLTNI